MLIIELLNPANIVDISTKLSTPFNYLIDSDTTLTYTAPISRHSTIRTLRVLSTRTPSLASLTSSYIYTV